MSNNNSWWQQYHEAIRSSQLRQELCMLVNGKQEVVNQLVNLEKHRHPGNLDSWYLNKILRNLRQLA